MTISAGWAEFNDANAVFRGRMVAATGTFSGTFASDNVEAVQELNIRDGAVSGYYGFDFASLTKTVEFTLPAQPFVQVADIIAPMRMLVNGIGATGTVTLYINGALHRSEGVRIDTESIFVQNKNDGYYRNGYIPVMQVVRFMDFNVSASQPTTYKIVLTDGSNGERGNIALNFLGNVVVGCRKR